MTNGGAIRAGFIPCESNPRTGTLSRTTEVFHGSAMLTVGQKSGNLRHVCTSCAQRFHASLKQRPGLIF
jgi:hypothetical protein